MKFTQRAVIPVARELLWEFLMDVPKVARSLPGVESVTQIDDTTYQGALKVRVGPISLNLQGKIILEQRDRENWRAALRAEASDRMAAGAVKGRTNMELKEISPKETELSVETDVNILGKIGEFGQPIIRKKADAMLQEFVENIKRQLTGSAG
ncbi:MAG TPA: SRPBCC family protein [Candidatus Binatia bacterium]|nr:SRPBCC family protein [Candidatus Binatia bacterium]